MNTNIPRAAFNRKFRNNLPVIAFEAFGKAQHSGQQSRFSSSFAAEGSEDGMFRSGFGFFIVIADQGGRHVFLPAKKSWNFCIMDQVFAVAMMTFAVDEHAAIVKQGRR